RLAIEAFGARKPYQPPELPKPEGPGRDWQTADLIGLAEHGLKGRSFEQGQKMFAATRCVVCHRFAGDGGATGPDLTQLAGRFTVKDLSEAMIEPSKVISDQYRAILIETKDGQIVSGRTVSESDGSLIVVTNPEDSTKTVEVRRDNIEAMQPSPVSLMPDGLLKPLNQDEVLDLLSYLLSRGNKNDAMFRK
ncbi:MAG: c-type cytochrome, partial [Pirellulales bacterium]